MGLGVGVRLDREQGVLTIEHCEILMIVFAAHPVVYNLLPVYFWQLMKLRTHWLLQIVHYAVLKLQISEQIGRHLFQQTWVNPKQFESETQLPVLQFVVLASVHQPLHILELVPLWIDSHLLSL